MGTTILQDHPNTTNKPNTLSQNPSQGCGWLWLGFWDRVLGLLVVFGWSCSMVVCGCVCFDGLGCWAVLFWAGLCLVGLGWVAPCCVGLGCDGLCSAGLCWALLGCLPTYLPTYLPTRPPTPNNGSGRGPPSTF